MPKPKGRVAQFIIYGENPETLASFYRAVFGWRITGLKFDEGLPPLFFIDDPRAGRGGALRGKVSPPLLGDPAKGFECVVAVRSVKRTATAVTRHGGRVVQFAPFMRGVGGLLRFEDPAGNLVQAAQMVGRRGSKATSNKRMQLTRSALANGRRGPRS